MRGLMSDILTDLNPVSILDVGCGDGKMTLFLAEFGTLITGIDADCEKVEMCREKCREVNIEFKCMDARNLTFGDNSFDLVHAAGVLHHIREWRQALDEMVRVSRRWVVIREISDDPRTPEKRNRIRIQRFFSELLAELGEHTRDHLTSEEMHQYAAEKGLIIETEILIKNNRVQEFEKACPQSVFNHYAERTGRKEYWIERQEQVKKEFEGTLLCPDDMSIYVLKR